MKNIVVMIYRDGDDLILEGYSSKKRLSERVGYTYKRLRSISKSMWSENGTVHVKLPINNFNKIKFPIDELTESKQID